VLEKKLDFLEKAITIDVHNGKALFTIFPGLCKGVGCAKRSAQKRPWTGRAHWESMALRLSAPMWNSVKHAGSVSRSVRIVPLPL